MRIQEFFIEDFVLKKVRMFVCTCILLMFIGGLVNALEPCNECDFIKYSPCCVKGSTYVDLKREGKETSNYLPGVTVIQEPTDQNSYECSKRALLKINFDALTKEPCQHCLNTVECGRRMLKIELELSTSQRQGWLFNLGDSVTNNGYKGDASTQTNDAETDGKYPNINVYLNENCPKPGAAHVFAANFIYYSKTQTSLTIYVSNEFIRVVTDTGYDEQFCHECHALKNRPDSTGPVNRDQYLGLNHVIESSSIRSGVGVCAAKVMDVP
ncbi:uncharacterized protein LOC132729662 [Ruditapes philippinarum]|uniref:uncharacterized protein LOC132729662 n=1 Tax=Ruditapes philippinarum TaxID=129788 RepID=UPI00295A9DF9|nr:uncharacterized protein LOC132729662 [Ruditapes philippinarum]